MGLSANYDIRELILSEVKAQTPTSQMQQTLQRGSVLNAVRKKLPLGVNDQAILTEWSDLFRTGLLAWGLNLMNVDPPHFHVTERGHQVITYMARDPANPAASPSLTAASRTSMTVHPTSIHQYGTGHSVSVPLSSTLSASR